MALSAPTRSYPASGAPSVVEFLGVSARTWTEGAFEELVRGLRSNECMVELVLDNYHDFSSLRLVEELLTTYNCTMKEVTWNELDKASQGRIYELLVRNARLRTRGTPEPDHRTWVPPVKKDPAAVYERYHWSSTSVWPRALEEYGRLPTLLYRFLRHGNLEGIANQVEAAALERPYEVNKKRRTTVRPGEIIKSRRSKRLSK